LAGEAPSLLYVPDLAGPGERLRLSEDEGHYVARVCRARAGDLVSATDGRGALARLRLTAIEPEVRAEVESLERAAPGRRAVVWCGAPEGERADWLIEKLAELGVTAFLPIDCRRASWQRAARRLERWRKLAVAALRQSHRRFLMEVHPPLAIEAALGALNEPSSRCIAERGGRHPERASAGPALTVGAVGPAGGFDDGERERFGRAGFEPMRLSDGQLRSETAALAWAAWWSAGPA
jgi:16S rRNA (uracil1498-N3)-methyltransferase